MKYFNALLLTTALFMNASFASDEAELVEEAKKASDLAHLGNVYAYWRNDFDAAITQYTAALAMPGLDEEIRETFNEYLWLVYQCKNCVDKGKTTSLVP